MHLAPQDNNMPPLSSKDCVANRHPGQVPQSGTRAGIQKQSDYIELSLDSGSRLPLADSSGMTGSANCDIVSKGRRDCCGVKYIGVFPNSKLLPSALPVLPVPRVVAGSLSKDALCH